MSTKKKAKQPNPDVRAILLACRVNAREMTRVLNRAHAWFGGDVSKFMRYAATTCPKPPERK